MHSDEDIWPPPPKRALPPEVLVPAVERRQHAWGRLSLVTAALGSVLYGTELAIAMYAIWTYTDVGRSDVMPIIMGSTGFVLQITGLVAGIKGRRSRPGKAGLLVLALFVLYFVAINIVLKDFLLSRR
jgi:hypothetical protein